MVKGSIIATIAVSAVSMVIPQIMPYVFVIGCVLALIYALWKLVIVPVGKFIKSAVKAIVVCLIASPVIAFSVYGMITFVSAQL